MVRLDWRKFAKIAEPGVVGLDIGTHSVKAVQLEKKRGSYCVSAAAEVRIETGGRGAPRGRSTVSAVRRCLAASGTRRRMVVCGLSGREVAVRSFQFPAMPSEEIESAIRFEAEQVCPFNPQEEVVDYELLGDGGDGVCGVLVAATRKLVDNKLELARDARLNCVLMDVEGLALLNCFHELDARRECPTAILNVGNSCTTLAISCGRNWPFVRDIPYAGRDILKRITAGRENGKELVADSPQPEEHSSGRPAAGLAGASRKLISEVNETLRFYGAQEQSPPIERILLCGGFSMEKGFAELMESRLPVAVERWNPFDTDNCSADKSCLEAIQESGPAMAVAAGLAMRTV
jgi:type IV pilus assembly protein PilM